MLRCSKCGRTYETETQKFCTHDGGRLSPYDEAASQAPTAYDLGQTVRTDPFDPEATVTRMPDLNKTVAAAPTSEIRPKETGPAAAPPAPTLYEPAPPPQQHQQPPAPPSRDVMPTVAFNQSPPPQQQQQHYQPQPAPPQHAPSPQHQYSPAPQHQQHPSQALAPGGRKSSRLPLIIGLIVLVLLGSAAAWYFLIYKKGESGAGANSNVANSNANSNANVSANSNENTNTNTNANTASSTPPRPPNSAQFVNASASLDGKLAEYYSNFSFYYPEAWEKDSKAGAAGASNFVKVERRLPPDFTQENFAVSWYESRGTFEADQAEIFPKLVGSLKSRYANSFPEFKVLSEGETTVNGIKGYEFRFQSVSRETEKGDITLWGRVIFLPPGAEGKKNGVQLLMLTTSLAPELTSADDVGIKGELPMILNSFRMGSN